jgi:CMP-N-acetylneuraminic acid synthetase
MENNSLYGRRVAGYLLETRESVNIDTLEDLEQAERVLQSRVNG